MARIALVLTKTPWRDRRPFFRQGPALAAAGHEVLYVAGPPDEDVAHPFTWVALTPRERALARRTGGLNLVARVRALGCDAVQLASLELLPLGLALKLVSRSRVVYDCREDIASAIYERRTSLPVFARKLLRGAIRALEALAARTFDGVVTADPAVRDLHAGMPAERKHVFYNTGLLSQFPPGYPRLADRPFELVVLGSMGSLRSGVPMVLDAMHELDGRGRKPNLLLIGQPLAEVGEAIASRVERYGLSERVEITGNVPHEQVAGLLARGRVGIVPLLDYPKFRRNIACKAFEYMACGMPTIASDLPPQHIFLHEGNALFFECGSVKGLVDRIEELLDDPDRCERMGRLGREEVESQWNAEHEQDEYRAFYARLLEMPLR